MSREPNYTPDPELVKARDRARQAEEAARQKKVEETRKEREAEQAEQETPAGLPQGMPFKPPAFDEIQNIVTTKVPPELAASIVDKHAEKCFNDLVNVVNKYGPVHPGTLLAVSMLEVEIRRIKYASLSRE